MTQAVVLDASAVLALLYGEPGQEEIRARLRHRGTQAIMNTVNFSEVAAKLAGGDSVGDDASRSGFDADEIRDAVGALALEVQPFDNETALAAGVLRSTTKDRGLSLEDRACIAHAQRIGGVALTLDRAWDGLQSVEVIQR